jgi:hypothetical protein
MHLPSQVPSRYPNWPAAFLWISAALSLSVQAASPSELPSGSAPSASRGQEFFTKNHGREWSCASCHGVVPTQIGKHASTGKSIGPLAPAFNAERFTDAAKTEKWFRRNCNDVVGRECTPAEKADVLNWLKSLKT